MFSSLRRDKRRTSEFRFSERDYDALIGTAVSLAGELETLIFKGMRAAQRSGEKGLQESDILALIERLKEIAAKGVGEMEARKNASTQRQEIVFDAVGHSRYVAPSANLLQAPGAAVNAATDAVNRGVVNASLIHEFILAEINVALQRWRVAFAAGVAEGNNSMKPRA